MTLNDDKIAVHYPKWAKPLVIVMLPLWALTAIWMILYPFLQTTLHEAQVILFPIFGAIALFQSTIGFRCFNYLNAKLVLHDQGVDLHHKGEVQAFQWDDLVINHYAFATTTLIKRKNGDTVIYFADGLPNLALLVDTIENGLN